MPYAPKSDFDLKRGTRLGWGWLWLWVLFIGDELGERAGNSKRTPRKEEVPQRFLEAASFSGRGGDLQLGMVLLRPMTGPGLLADTGVHAGDPTVPKDNCRTISSPLELELPPPSGVSDGLLFRPTCSVAPLGRSSGGRGGFIDCPPAGFAGGGKGGQGVMHAADGRRGENDTDPCENVPDPCCGMGFAASGGAKDRNRVSGSDFEGPQESV